MSEKSKGQAKLHSHEVWEHSEEIARLYTQDLIPTQQIGEIYGCSQAVIRKILHSMGVRIPKTALNPRMPNFRSIKV